MIDFLIKIFGANNFYENFAFIFTHWKTDKISHITKYRTKLNEDGLISQYNTYLQIIK